MGTKEEQVAASIEAVQELKARTAEVMAEIGKVIVDQEEIIREILIALFARGHCLLVGVPGLAKTLLINTLARVLDLTFNRIQFTPDLMPSDITGTDILEEDPATGRRAFKFLRGPIFTNILLADEINRTPPKTQAALLQAMQEYRVTAGGVTFPLDLPFFVLATQNPIEQEGTYPLPEAQLDRFMFFVSVNYPSFEAEQQIVARTTSAEVPALHRVMDGPAILAIQDLVRQVPASDYVIRYAVKLTQASRPGGPAALSSAADWVAWGAGPRASQYLILGAKAAAVMEGRFAASVEDVRAVAAAVLRHRILTNFKAQAEEITSLDIIRELLATVLPDPV